MNLFKLVGSVYIETSKAESQLKKVEGVASGVASGFKAVGSKMTEVGKSMMKVTAGIAAVGAYSVKQAASLESAIDKVKALSGATEAETKALSDKAKEIGASTEWTAEQVADAMQYMALAGWKSEQMLDGVQGVMDAASASGEDLSRVCDIVTDGLSAFGMKASDSSHFADVLATTAANANTTIGGLGKSFEYCASLAGSLGFSVEDVAESIGLMADQGIKGSKAGTTLRSVFTNLAGSAEFSFKKTDENGKAVELLNVQIQDAKGNMRDWGDIVSDFRSEFDKLTESQKSSAAYAIAGKTGMSGWLSLMNSEKDTVEGLNKAINDCDGKAGEMADTMRDNLNGQLTILKSSIDAAAISIGEKLAPYVGMLAEKIQGAVDWFNNLSESQQDMIVKVALAVAAIGPLLIALGAVITTIGNIITAIQTIQTVVSAVSAALPALGAALSGALPVIGIVAAVAAIGIALYELITHWEEVKEWCSTFVDAFKLYFEDLANTIPYFIDWLVDGVKEKFSKLVDIVGGIWQKIKDFFAGGIPVPNIKLPHFQVKPEGWKISDLLEGEIPKLGVEWYAKGGVMKKPTVFGRNGDKAMVGGEAGYEAIAPIDTLQGYVTSAVSGENSALESKLNAIISILCDYLPNIGNDIVLNDGTLVGKTAKKYDSALGKLNSRQLKAVNV